MYTENRKQGENSAKKALFLSSSYHICSKMQGQVVEKKKEKERRGLVKGKRNGY